MNKLQKELPSKIPFKEALLFWTKLGFISFGGPAGQISMMHQELVENKRWISENRFLNALNYCMVLPGPEAQQLATYMGWLMHGTLGGIIAGTLFVLPSLLILILLSWIYIAFGEMSIVAGLFFGIKSAVIAIVIQATYRMGSRTLKNKWLWGMAICSFLATAIINIPFPALILVAMMIGYFGGQYYPKEFGSNQQGHQQSDKKPLENQAIIYDNDILPSYAKFSWNQCFKILGIGGLLWLLPMSFLTLIYGWNHTLTQMGWFFTKSALLTFGGAYAVLPYVYQGAVNHYGWLTPTQMIDGLALGETTPGPLIMIVAFVGFIGGYVQAFFGADALFLAGIIASCVVTWFTFLPSFILILAGAPFIESTHHEIKLTAPLTAITATVVGVILNLALFFGYHVLFPQGFSGHFEWISAIITVGSLVALFHFKQSVIKVIMTSALIGLIIKFIF